MKSTTTVLLFLLAAALAAFIFYVEKNRPGTRELSETPPLRFDPAQATFITITRSGATLALQKKGDRWFLARPVEDRADQKACADFLETLTRLAIREVIHTSEIDSGSVSLDDLGLTAGKAIALHVLGPDGPLGAVSIGHDGALENTSYVAFPENPRYPHVYVVDAKLSAFGARSVTALRDPRVLPFEPARIGRLLLRNGDAEVEVFRDTRTGLWRLGKPLQSRANQEAVDQLVASVCALEITGFEGDNEVAATIDGRQSVSAWVIDPATGAVPAAGDPPTLTVAIARASESRPPETAGSAPQTPGEEQRIIAKVSDRETVLQVPEIFLEILSANPTTLRDDHLAQLPEKEIRGIIIRSDPNPDVILAHNGRRWISLRNGEWEPANEEAVDALLRGLNRERVIDFVVDTPASLADYRLSPPDIRIGLTTSRKVMAPDSPAPPPDMPPAAPDDPETEKNYLLGLGRVPAAAENDIERLYAAFADEPFVVSIDPAFLTLVPLHPLHWKDPGVLNFSIVSLREIRIAQAGDPVPTRLAYDPLVDQWTLTRGDTDLTGQLDRARAHALAEALGSFAARNWLSTRETANRALEKPALTIDLVLSFLSDDGSKDVTEHVRLQFAPVAETEAGPSRLHYGRRNDSPEVFVVEDKTLQAILAPVTK